MGAVLFEEVDVLPGIVLQKEMKKGGWIKDSRFSGHEIKTIDFSNYTSPVKTPFVHECLEDEEFIVTRRVM